MIKESVAKLLNEQIIHEFYSSYLYLEFSNYYTEQNLDGFANWFRIQAQEEKDHALLFMDYMHNNGLKVTLDTINRPEADLKDRMDPLKKSLEHEKLVTSLINAIYEEAYNVRDFRTMQFLDWFIKEQGEEEKSAGDLISKMELFGTDPKGLYMLNSELGTRIYTAPSLVLD